MIPRTFVSLSLCFHYLLVLKLVLASEKNMLGVDLGGDEKKSALFFSGSSKVKH